MSISYTIDKNLNIINEIWIGEITAEDLKHYWNSYLADQEVIQCRRTLVDMRKAIVKFDGTELASLVETIVAPKLGPLKWISALLVEIPVQYGVVRPNKVSAIGIVQDYGVFAEFYSKDQIFFDYESAYNWLVGQKL